MSNIYVSDKEQVEMLRKWWRENGKFTLGSIAVALALSAGWRYWQNAKIQDRAAASVVYEQMLNQEANHNYQAVETNLIDLQVNHPHTPYAALASLIAAQNAVKDNKLDIALQKLNWVIHNSRNDDFVQIAKMRLARVYLSLKKYDDALTVLNVVTVKGYLPLIQEIKGDVYLAKGDINNARTFYQNALNSLPRSAPNRSLLEMKLNQVRS